MAYLFRKISRAKWDNHRDLDSDEIPADAVTADLKTTDNALSFWKWQTSSENEIRNTVLAIVAVADRLDKIDITWIEEECCVKEDIYLEMTKGNTPVVTLQDRHIDVARLDVHRLTSVAMFIHDSLKAGRYQRLTKKEVLAVVSEAVQQNILSIDKLKDNLRMEVEKFVTEQFA